MVRDRGSARVTELATLLDVSPMTIRRDLDHLEERALLVKVHGGATLPLQRSADEPGFAVKAARNHAEKLAIARECATFVAPGSAVGITGGTTTVEIAELIASTPSLTVVTNSLAVAHVLHQHDRPDLTVVLTGGVRTPSASLVGPITISSLESFHLDLLFMGVHGMHHEAGFTTPNLLEAETNRAFIRAANEVIIAADHTKWQMAGLTTIAPLAAASTIVTDDGLAEGAVSQIQEVGPRVMVCPSDHRD